MVVARSALGVVSVDFPDVERSECVLVLIGRLLSAKCETDSARRWALIDLPGLRPHQDHSRITIFVIVAVRAGFHVERVLLLLTSCAGRLAGGSRWLMIVLRGH